MSYITNLFESTEENHFFRKVLYTGQKSQLVVMTLKQGEVIDKEKHEHVEQLLFVLEGRVQAILGDDVIDVDRGGVIVVSPNTWHEIRNIGDGVAKIYTVYSPANHIDGRIHVTKEDAKHDEEDEAFGERAA